MPAVATGVVERYSEAIDVSDAVDQFVCGIGGKQVSQEWKPGRKHVLRLLCTLAALLGIVRNWLGDLYQFSRI